MATKASHIALLQSLAKRGDIYAEELLRLDAKGIQPLTPVWDDLPGSISEGAGNSALTYENYRDTGFKFYFMRRDQPDELNFVFQMRHSWDPTTAVRPHIHMAPMANPVAPSTVALTAKYAWSRTGTALAAAAGWTTLNATHTVNPGDLYIDFVLSLGFITPPEGMVESSMLYVQVVRNTVADNFEVSKDHGTAAANLCVKSVDVHFQAWKLGTITEFPS